MAGSYPDVPSRRMAWDADGSIGLVRFTSQASVSELSSAERANLNSEENNQISGVINQGWFGAIFPELREFDGIFAKTTQTNVVDEIETSGDTTNGLDGSWSTAIANFTDTNSDVYPEYRDGIESAAVSNVRMVRAVHDGAQATIKTLHLYGEIAAGETPDRLLWVDNSTGSEFGLPIDYGDIPRGSAEDTEVLLRNNSGSLTAASVQVTAEALYLGSGAWYTFKEAGGSFQSTLPLSSSIGAGSDSPVLTIRRVTPDDETVGAHAARAYASVGSWS